MGLFEFTLMQNQRFRYSMENSWGGGGGMQVAMYKLEGWVVSCNVTAGCCRGTRENQPHGTELKCGTNTTSGHASQSLPERAPAISRLRCGEDYNSLEE